MEVPIKTIHLFSILDKKLIELLSELSEADWQQQTLAKKWCVKDIAAHLLDGNLRTLSMLRDGYFGEKPYPPESVINYLNRLNADWVTSFKRISHKVLIQLLESSGEEYINYLHTLEPFKTSTFSVGWAGEQESKNWFHVAREYTEKWHHQQQIREAIGVDGIMSKELFSPVLQTFMMALPYTYRNIEAAEGSIVHVILTGESGGTWAIGLADNKWIFIYAETKPSAKIEINQRDAWKLFTKGISSEEAERKVLIEGDFKLASQVLKMVSVMA